MSIPGLGGQKELADLVSRAKDLQGRILFVLGAFIVYRLGTHIPLPGIDAQALTAYQGQLQQGLLGMFNMLSGGAFSRMALFALNIMPYITASIIIQLLAATYPSLQELKKEGETGQRKLNQYTRYFTVVLAFLQGFGLAAGLETQTVTVGSEVASLVVEPGIAFKLHTALSIMTGTMFLMWLGEQINSRGIGNGISLLIYAGIVAEIPAAIYQTVELSRVGSVGGFMLLALILGIVAILGFMSFMETAQRRIPVQYPKRQATGGAGRDASHLPLKINMSGVIPPIFASALLLAPLQMASFYPNSAFAQTIGGMLSPGSMVYSLAFMVLIVFFCFFYTATVVFKPEETADNLKRNGGFIPGIRPGKSTADYLDGVATRLTVIGSIYLAVVCTVPDIIRAQMNIPFYFGGTSLLIIVSVTIDTITRIQSALIAQKYEALLKKTKLRGRGGPRGMAAR